MHPSPALLRRLAAAAAATVVALSSPTPAHAHPVQAATGSAARPILSPAEAVPYTAANYLGWSGT
jgi:pectin methylesterase-like acyl-CoA thioesterase